MPSGRVVQQSPAGGAKNGVEFSGIDVNIVEQKLDRYASNLIDHIRQNMPDATMEEIVGGFEIVPYGSFPVLRETSNPNLVPSEPVTIWPNEIDDLYRTRLVLNGDADCNVSGTFFGAKMFADEIDVQRLTVTSVDSTKAELRLNGNLKATWTGILTNSLKLNVCIDFPYPTSGGLPPSPGTTGPLDQKNREIALTIQPNYSYAILNSWGDTGAGRISYSQNLLLENQGNGLPVGDEAIIGQSLAINAINWLSQESSSRNLLGALTDKWLISHAIIGVFSQKTGPGVDIPIGLIAFASRSTLPIDRLQTLYSQVGPGSAFESTTIEQLTDSPGVSTVTLISNVLGNSEILYEIASVSDFDNAVFVGYPGGLLPGSVLSGIRGQLVAAGSSSSLDRRYIIPKSGNVSIGDWTGYSFIRQEVNGSVETGSIGIGYAINGSKGGFPTVLYDFVDTANATIEMAEIGQEQKSLFQSVGQLVSDPVNTFTGDYIYNNTDLTVGSRVFPHGLGFQRSYSSGARLQDGPLGLGWQHNFGISASEYSDSAQGFGQDSPIDAAAMIVALYVGNDLASQFEIERILVATLAQDWGTQYLFDNVVTVSIPGQAQTFVKLPAGLGYNPPRKSNAALTKPSNFVFETLDGTEITFDSDGDISSWENANGFGVTFTYDGSKRLDLVENDFGWKLDLTYGAEDRIASVSDTLGRSVAFAYDAAGNLTSYTDPEGEDTAYEYAPNFAGRMTKIFYPSRPAVAFIKNVYDSVGRITEQTNPNTGPNNPYRYFIAGTRSEEIDPLGNSRVWYQDHLGNVIREIDQLGRVTTTEFDGLSRPVETVLPEGNSIAYTYDDATCTMRCTNNVKSITRIPDADRGGPTLSEQFTYWGANKNYKVRRQTDARSNFTVNTYDNSGNLLTVTEPSVGGTSPVTTFEYFGTGPRKGLLLKVTDPSGLGTRFTIQAATGFLLDTRLNPNGLDLKTQFGYDTWGNIKTVTDPEGRVSTSYSDCARRVRATVPPAPGAGATTLPKSRITYDADGRVRFSSLVTGNVSGLECNASSGGPGTVIQESERQYFNNGMLKKTISPDGAETSYTYDLLDRLLSVTDPDGRKARSVLNAAGQVKNTRIEKGTFSLITGRFQYNMNGVNTSVQDANFNRTEFLYDGLDRLIETHYSSLTTANTSNPNDKEVYEYNENGSLTRKTTRAGQDTVLTYDPLNRLKTKTPDGSQKVTYKYDLAGRQTEVLFSTGAAYSITYGYDTAGRLTSVTDDGRLVSYKLNNSSERIQLDWPDGPKISYQYDDAGRIKSIRRGTAAAPSGALASYSYDTFGRRSGEQFGVNGAAFAKTYTYDSDNALASLQINLPGTANDVTFDLTYLPANQIETKTISNPAYVYSEPFNKAQSYTSNRLNQIESVVYGTGFTFNLSYDANGNLTSDGRQWTYTYDTENRLIKAIGRNTVATYSYDPLGRRATKTVTGSINEDIRYLYDAAEIIADTNTSNVVQRRYIYGPGIDEPVAMYAGSGTSVNIRRFYMADPQGSVIGLTDASGVLQDSHSYSAFGMPDDWGSDTTGNPLRYTGQRWDAESGLYFYRARYYSPALGRFLTVDPIGYGDGLNVYAYVGNDPVNLVDPSGLGAELLGQGLGAAYDYSLGPQSPIGNVIQPWATAADYVANDTVFGDPGFYASIQGAGPPGALIGSGGLLFAGGLRQFGTFGRSTKATGLGNPFAGKTATEIDTMLNSGGFIRSGPNPVAGTGGYVNPNTGRSYHIDPKNWGKYPEPNHIDINRPRGYKGPLDKKKLPYRQDD